MIDVITGLHILHQKDIMDNLIKFPHKNITNHHIKEEEKNQIVFEEKRLILNIHRWKIIIDLQDNLLKLKILNFIEAMSVRICVKTKDPSLLTEYNMKIK